MKQLLYSAVKNCRDRASVESKIGQHDVNTKLGANFRRKTDRHILNIGYQRQFGIIYIAGGHQQCYEDENFQVVLVAICTEYVASYDLPGS
jgi:hypothetical protein